jgi:hypothetical protein
LPPSALFEIPGAGDAEYLGSIHTSSTFRLNSGDLLKVNFRIDNPVDDENWTFTVIDPFSWTLQGETVGILKRPRQPAPTDADPKAFRPYQACFTQLY